MLLNPISGFFRNFASKKNEKFDSFIFTHIPRCGGSSLRKFLYDVGISNNVTDNEMFIPEQGQLLFSENISALSNDRLVDLRRRKIKIIADHSKYNVHKEFSLNLKRPFYYTILRYPVNRAISHYYFFFYFQNELGYKGRDLNDLSEYELHKVFGTFANLQVLYLINPNYKLPWSLERSRLRRGLPYGLQLKSNWVDYAFRRLKNKYESFGILERINESLGLLSSEIPEWLTVGSVSLPHVNSSSSRTGKSIEDYNFNKNVTDFIKEYNKHDMSLYNRTIELFEERLHSKNLKA